MDIGWFTLFFSAFTAAIGFFGNMLYERKKQLRDKATDERRVIYSEFIDIMIDRIQVQQDTPPEANEVFHKRMFEFYKNYLLYASPDVINAVGEFQQYSMQQEQVPLSEQNAEAYYLKYAKVIFEMREDLGLSVKQLGTNGQHIFKTFFSNYHEIFTSNTSDSR